MRKIKMVNPLTDLMRVYQGPTTVNINKCASFTPFTEIVEKLVAIHKHNELARRVLGLDMRDDLIDCGFRWGLFIITRKFEFEKFNAQSLPKM